MKLETIRFWYSHLSLGVPGYTFIPFKQRIPYKVESWCWWIEETILLRTSRVAEVSAYVTNEGYAP